MTTSWPAFSLKIKKLLPRLVLAMATGCAPATALSSAVSCSIDGIHTHEQAIVQSILNQQHMQVERLLGQLDPKRAIIPEPGFYRALSTWYRGYQNSDRKLKKLGIKKLMAEVESVERKYTDRSSKNDLIVGLVKGYSARALLENEQIVRGYEIGSDAVDRMERYIGSVSPSSPGYRDATFLLGLYYVYTHDLNTRSHWLIGTVGREGDRAQGVEWIRQAIAGPAIFSVEAARALLSEVSWRTPDICRMVDFSQHANRELPLNADLALIVQGLLLKCGDAETALQINNRYQEHDQIHPQLQQKMLKARLRILADLGRPASLSTLKLSPDLEPYRRLAVANALDITDERNLAQKHYRQLQGGRGIPEELKQVARVRLRYPYRSPKKRNEDQDKIVLSLCRIRSS